MAPLVKDLPSYIKHVKHALQILQNIHFHGTHKFIFTRDVKSLCSVIPHHDSLRALEFFL
jgi:retron-type reverse transcriptase